MKGLTIILTICMLTWSACKKDNTDPATPTPKPQVKPTDSTAYKLMPLNIGNMWTYVVSDSSFKLIHSTGQAPLSSYPDSISNLQSSQQLVQWRVLTKVLIDNFSAYLIQQSDVTIPSTPTVTGSFYLSREGGRIIRIDTNEIEWAAGHKSAKLRLDATPDTLFDFHVSLVDYAPGKLPSSRVTYQHTAPFFRQYAYFQPAHLLNRYITKTTNFDEKIGIRSDIHEYADAYKYPGTGSIFYVEISSTTMELISFELH